MSWLSSRQWAPKDEPASFEALVDSVLDTLKYAYHCKSRQRKSLPTENRFIAPAGACNPTTNWYFSAEGLKYEKERGRGVLTVIISDAIRLGMEQGRRAEARYAIPPDRLAEAWESAEFWRKKYREVVPETPEDIAEQNRICTEILNELLAEEKAK